jgi:lysozyme
MRTNKRGLDLIKEFEGFRLTPYLCSADVPTIGYGSTFYENGTKVSLVDKPISRARAEQLLTNTVADFEKKLYPILSGIILNDNQFSALVSFTFNVGVANFKKSTLLKIIRENPNDKDITEQFLRWNKANKKELPGLTRRRQAEAKLYFS